VLHTALTGSGGEHGSVRSWRSCWTVIERHHDKQLASMALMVWSEALRNPALAERLEVACAGEGGDTGLPSRFISSRRGPGSGCNRAARP
jgi:hypothetical protein